MKTPNTSRKRYIPGLATQLIVLVVVVALIVGGAIGIVLTNTSANSLRQDELRYSLAQADLAAQFVSNYVKTIETGVRSFAARPSVVQAVISDTPEKLQVELSQFVQIQVAIEGTGVYDAQGIQRVSSLTNATTIGQPFADRDWFQQAAATLQPYLSIPTKSRVNGRPIVPYAIPILDDQGQLRGVVTAGISLGMLSDSIVKVDYGHDTRPSIIDTRNGGIILANSDPQLVLTPVSGTNEVIVRLMAGERGTIETSSSGEMDLIGYTKVPDFPWGVTITTPSSTALAPVDSLRLQATLIISISVLVVGFLGGLFMIRITKPLILLRDASRKLAAGELTYRVNMTQRNEVGELGRAFDQMAVSLSEKERQLQDYAAQLEQKVEERTVELTRSNADLAQFAYVASHDLQEPLRMVSSYLQLIEQRYKDKLDAAGSEFMNYAVDGANRMQVMINDLLTFSRVGTKGKSFEPTDCEVILNQTLANLQVAIEDSQAIITHDPLPRVIADDTQMMQLFQNLIGNAIKFRRQEPLRVHISAQVKEREWVFSVRDNGIGIDPQYFERLFVIFQRLHNKEEYPGTGIGLAVCKRVVERHGGKIWVESQPGQGSTFYFTIPQKGGK